MFRPPYAVTIAAGTPGRGGPIDGFATVVSRASSSPLAFCGRVPFAPLGQLVFGSTVAVTVLLFSAGRNGVVGPVSGDARLVMGVRH